MPLSVQASEPPQNCDICPRLLGFRTDNQTKLPRGFNGAVPSFGDIEAARLIIVGLAPGLNGANFTGRPFTGDYAGDLLYSTLLKFGFASGNYAARADDGLRLNETLITNAVRCVPPENKPTSEEINACRFFLKNLITQAPKVELIVTLGKIAHDSTVRALGDKVSKLPFGHGHTYQTGKGLTLISSYHCSRYNTNTGKLTTAMFEDIFKTARERISETIDG